MSELKKTPPKKQGGTCETCVYFDYDEFYGEDVCRADLDEDESIDFMSGTTNQCPLYRFYDEYKSVQKQN